MRALLLALALLAVAPVVLGPGRALAVRPDEMLANPKLEARARKISEGLRCLVCRNESIDDSNADLAHDLRVLVRDRLKAGDTNQQVVDYIVSRYGQFVLLKPRFSVANAPIWLAGPVVFLIGLAIAVGYLRRQRPRAAANEAPLTDEEKRRLQALLKEG